MWDITAAFNDYSFTHTLCLRSDVDLNLNFECKGRRDIYLYSVLIYKVALPSYVLYIVYNQASIPST